MPISFVKKHHAQAAFLCATFSLLLNCANGDEAEAPIRIGENLHNVDPPSFLSWHMAQNGRANFSYGFENGYNGTGVLVGLIDTGIDVNHSYLSGSIHPLSTNVSDGTGIDDQNGHGTKMAGLIVGQDVSGLGPIGVASGAELLVVNTFDADNGGFLLSDLAEAIQYAADNGAQIINLSLGGSNHNPNLAYVNAITYATDHGIVVFAATGNSGQGQIADAPAYFAGSADMNGLLVAVTAVDSNLELAWFAQGCNVINPYYCLAAPGVNVLSTEIEGFGYGSGTSQATAIASGALAALMSRFPNLSAEQALDILITTAVDLGAPGVDPIYGSGLIDLEAAMAPIGETRFKDGAEISALQASAIEINGAAFSNDAFNLSELSAVPFKDAFERLYLANFSQSILQSRPSFEDRLHSATYGLYLEGENFAFANYVGFLTGDLEGNHAHEDALKFLSNDLRANPFVAMAALDHRLEFGKQARPLSYHMRLDLGISGESLNTYSAFSVESAPNPHTTIMGTVGVLQEDRAVLGLRPQGAFGEIAYSTTIHFSLGVQTNIGGWDVSGRMGIAHASAKMGRSGLISEVTDIAAREWMLSLGKNSVLRANDRLDIAIGQKLSVYQGKLRFDQNKVNLSAINFGDSTPKSQFEIGYALPIAENIRLQLNALYETNGNKNDAQFGGAIGLSFTF